MRFLWGTVGVIVGFLIIKYTFQIVQTFGHVGWAEQHLPGGGTYTLYKLAGLIIIILSLLYAFNAIGFLINPLTPLFGGR